MKILERKQLTELVNEDHIEFWKQYIYLINKTKILFDIVRVGVYVKSEWDDMIKKLFKIRKKKKDSTHGFDIIVGETRYHLHMKILEEC